MPRTSDRPSSRPAVSRRFAGAVFTLFAGAALPAAAQSAGPSSPQTPAQPPAATTSGSSAPGAPAAPPRCDGDEHRQFDFWQGSWEVISRQQPNRPPASNVIEVIHDGCVVHEQYRAGAYTGSSLSFYDRQVGAWHQTWIDNTGTPLYLTGGLDERGRMVLSRTTDDGTIDRITWTPNDDGTVRQHWQRSTDGGETWADAFDGLYRRR